MLKKYLIGTAVVALFAFAMTVSAVDFGSTTLKVGSKGEAVKAVQTLVGATVDGSYGPKTAAKVMVWQAANGLKADGAFGKLSMAMANAGSVTPTTPVATGCQAGWAFNPATGLSCTGTPTTPTTPVVTGTTDGSVTASTSSYVSSGIQVKKGETKDIAAVRLQATAGPVKVSRVDVKFSVRPWLFFSTVALHDNAGKVLATKTLTGISDTTELVVGSEYMVRFDGIDYTVTPGTNPDIAVSASVLAATDKIPTLGQPVTATFMAMRTTSEIGYVDSPTISQANTVTLTSTGSVADIYTRISPSSPLTGQQIVNATQTTADVTLGAFSLKSSANASTLNTLKVVIGGTATDTTDFSNFRLYVGGVSVAGGSLSSHVITFSNLTVPLALDVWTDLTIKADIIAASSGDVKLTLTPDTTTVVVTDSNYGTPNIQSGARVTNTLTLTQNSVTVSGVSAVLGAAIVQAQVTTGYQATYAFTLTNNSNNDLYVSTTAGTFLSATATGSVSAAASGLTSVTVSPSTVSGDDSSNLALYYSIPTGTARTFTMAAVLRGATGGTTVFKASSINYSTSSTLSPVSTITTGLSALSLTASF